MLTPVVASIQGAVDNVTLELIGEPPQLKAALGYLVHSWCWSVLHWCLAKPSGLLMGARGPYTDLPTLHFGPGNPKTPSY